MIELVAAGLLLVLLSAMFSGCETGIYSLSRLRVETDAERGARGPRIIRWMLRDESLLLITILVGNNLMIELLTHVFELLVIAGDFVGPELVELAVALLLSPVAFFFAELLPKELFRNRPHLLVGLFAPLLAAARILFVPVALPLRWFSQAALRLMRVPAGDLSRAMSRESVQELLAEGTRMGRLEPRAERLAQNVLNLRATRLESEMIPWSEVETLAAEGGIEDLRRRVRHSRFSRLPVVAGGRVEGYVHQLDVLREGKDADPLALQRPLPALPADLSVDRALVRLRRTGQRAALVGEPDAPRGLVTLKDLVETISGDLAGW